MIYKGRKSFENQVSLFQLLQEKLVYNNKLSIGGVCLYRYVYICMQHMCMRGRNFHCSLSALSTLLLFLLKSNDFI